MATHVVRIEQRLQGRVRVVGWRAGRPAPGAVMVSETSPTARVVWFALDDRSKSVVHDLGRNAEGVCEEPVAGAEFLAMALRVSRPTLLALDLQTRENLIADAPLRLPSGSASIYQLAPAGPYLALRSLHWIVLHVAACVECRLEVDAAHGRMF